LRWCSRGWGRSSLGVCYALSPAELVLASVIPPQRCELGQLSGYPVTGTSWLPAEMVPGLCSLALVPLVVCGLWISSRWHGLDFAISALLGSSVWSGGLLMPGKALNDTGVTRPFARAVGTAFGSCLPGRVSRSWRPG
jgi:hypothetical protein